MIGFLDFDELCYHYDLFTRRPQFATWLKSAMQAMCMVSAISNSCLRHKDLPVFLPLELIAPADLAENIMNWPTSSTSDINIMGQVLRWLLLGPHGSGACKQILL